MKTIIKYILFFFTLNSLIHCNGEDKKVISSNNYKKETKIFNDTIPNFLDKKYFKKYQLSADNDYPQYTFRNNKVGEIVVDYIAKNVELQQEWKDIDSRNNIMIEEEATDEQLQQINLLVKRKLEPDLENYFIIAEYIKPIYLVKNSYDYIYPYKKNYYLYDEEKKSWTFLKIKTVTDGNDEKNITKLNELNTIINQKSLKSEDKNTSSQINAKTLNRWNGTYDVHIDYGKLDENSEMAIDFSIEIKNKSCTFSGMGYKTDFTDQCKIEEIENSLILKFEKNIDGDGFSDHSNINILGNIIYKNGDYYLKSPIVANSKWDYNTEIKIKKSK